MKNRIIRAIAGLLVLTSILLSIYVSTAWLLLAVFVSANLIQSSITKWCLMEDILTWLNIKD